MGDYDHETNKPSTAIEVHLHTTMAMTATVGPQRTSACSGAGQGVFQPYSGPVRLPHIRVTGDHVRFACCCSSTQQQYLCRLHQHPLPAVPDVILEP